MNKNSKTKKKQCIGHEYPIASTNYPYYYKKNWPVTTWKIRTITTPFKKVKFELYFLRQKLSPPQTNSTCFKYLSVKHQTQFIKFKIVKTIIKLFRIPRNFTE